MLGGLLLEGSGMLGSYGKDRHGTPNDCRQRREQSGMTLNELFQRANQCENYTSEESVRDDQRLKQQMVYIEGK